METVASKKYFQTPAKIIALTCFLLSFPVYVYFAWFSAPFYQGTGSSLLEVALVFALLRVVLIGDYLRGVAELWFIRGLLVLAIGYAPLESFIHQNSTIPFSLMAAMIFITFQEKIRIHYVKKYLVKKEEDEEEK